MIYYMACDNLKDVNELYKEWTGNDINQSQPSLGDYLVIAKDDDKIIGAAQIMVRYDQVWGRRWGLIENVYVAEGYRRQGIGRGIMEFIESIFISLYKCQFLKLTSSKPVGQLMYRSLGYEEGASFKKWIKM